MPRGLHGGRHSGASLLSPPLPCFSQPWDCLVRPGVPLPALPRVAGALLGLGGSSPLPLPLGGGRVAMVERMESSTRQGSSTIWRSRVTRLGACLRFHVMASNSIVCIWPPASSEHPCGLSEPTLEPPVAWCRRNPPMSLLLCASLMGALRGGQCDFQVAWVCFELCKKAAVSDANYLFTCFKI